MSRVSSRRSTGIQELLRTRALAFTKKNIRSAFAKTGIHPFDPSVVLKALEKQIAKKLGDQSTGGRIYNYKPFSEARLTDYGEENSGIRGLDDRWYTRTPFFQTPYGAKGIYEHATFLEKYEEEMSSPSRRLSNHKFRKGAQIEANLGAIARERLAQKDEQNTEDLQKHARKEQEEEDSLTKARKELERAERRHQAELDRVEKERKREEDIARKEQEKLDKATKREQEKAERDERKRIEEEAKEARRQGLLAQGKKPRGRKRKIDAIQSQNTETSTQASM
ncbi:hypothetical protein BGZ57DRAFT_862457 [Hyaloscypha finlandica]|nr:hypothetical protein BGZ57DRAFT_862457 [Hyaloscypha finlandica]